MSISLVTTNIICRQNICQTTKLNAMEANIAKLILLDIHTCSCFYSHIRSMPYSFNGNMGEMLLKKGEIEEKARLLPYHTKLRKEHRGSGGDKGKYRERERERERKAQKKNEFSHCI